MTSPAGDDGAGIRREIERFIVENFVRGSRPGAIRDDTKVLGGTLLDSIAMLELTVHLEERYGVTISASEITPDNFGTIGSVARFIAGRLGRG